MNEWQITLFLFATIPDPKKLDYFYMMYFVHWVERKIKVFIFEDQ